MSANPPVKVGDRIVALSVSESHAPECLEFVGEIGTVERIRDDGFFARFREGDTGYGCDRVTSWRLADPEPYRPEVGHRVRVVLEGEVDYRIDPPYEGFSIGGSELGNAISESAPHVVSIERLPDAEPEWWPPQTGDVVRLRQGRHALYAWDGTGWRNSMTGLGALLESFDPHDFTLLVRDGKPVDGAS